MDGITKQLVLYCEAQALAGDPRAQKLMSKYFSLQTADAINRCRTFKKSVKKINDDMGKFTGLFSGLSGSCPLDMTDPLFGNIFAPKSKSTKKPLSMKKPIMKKPTKKKFNTASGTVDYTIYPNRSLIAGESKEVLVNPLHMTIVTVSASRDKTTDATLYPNYVPLSKCEAVNKTHLVYDYSQKRHIWINGNNNDNDSESGAPKKKICFKKQIVKCTDFSVP